MKTIFIYSDMYHTTNRYLELPMYNYIKNTYGAVKYVLQEGDIRLTDPELSKVYGSLDLEVIKKPKHLGALFDKDDVLLMRWIYKNDGAKAAESVIAKGNKVVMFDNPGIDVKFRKAPAHYVAVKGKSLFNAVKKAYPQYKGLFTTGLLHADLISSVVVDRTEFMKSYGMDPGKKLVLLTPANPGEAHMKGLKEDYARIFKIVSSHPEYEIAVKAHPNDYTARMPAQPGIIHKSQHYQGRCSWEVFAPNAKVIKAEEGYEAIKACDAVLNIRSSLAMELALFKKPLININRANYLSYWPADPNCMTDITMDQLDAVLVKGKFDAKEAGWANYVKEHMHSDDGQAYKRIADLAQKVVLGQI